MDKVGRCWHDDRKMWYLFVDPRSYQDRTISAIRQIWHACRVLAPPLGKHASLILAFCSEKAAQSFCLFPQDKLLNLSG